MLAVISVGSSTMKPLKIIPAPKLTAVAPLRLLPIIVTNTSSPGAAEAGSSEVIVGGGATVKPLARVAIPLGVVTETSLGPSIASGGMWILAVIWVGLSTVKLSMIIPGKLTPVAPLRLLPVMTIDISSSGPAEAGLSEVIVGGGISVVNDLVLDQSDQAPLLSWCLTRQ